MCLLNLKSLSQRRKGAENAELLFENFLLFLNLMTNYFYILGFSSRFRITTLRLCVSARTSPSGK